MDNDLISKVLKHAEGNTEILKRFLEEVKEGSRVKITSKYKYEANGRLENKFYSPCNGHPEYIMIILENGAPYCIPYNHIQSFEQH